MKTLFSIFLLLLFTSLSAQERLTDFKSSNSFLEHLMVNIGGVNYEIVLGRSGAISTYTLDGPNRKLNHSRSFDLNFTFTLRNNRTLLLRTQNHLVLYDFISDTFDEFEFDPCYDVMFFFDGGVLNNDKFIIQYIDKCLFIENKYILLDKDDGIQAQEIPHILLEAFYNHLVLLDRTDIVLWSVAKGKEILRLNRLESQYLTINEKFYFYDGLGFLKVINLDDPEHTVKPISTHSRKLRSTFSNRDDNLAIVSSEDSTIIIEEWDKNTLNKTTRSFKFEEPILITLDFRLTKDYIVIKLGDQIHCIYLEDDKNKDFTFQNPIDRNYKDQFWGNSFFMFTDKGAKFIDIESKHIKDIDDFAYPSISLHGHSQDKNGIYVKRRREDVYYLDPQQADIIAINSTYNINVGMEQRNIFTINNTVILRHKHILYTIQSDGSLNQISTGKIMNEPIVGQDLDKKVLLFFEEENSVITTKKTDGTSVISLGTIPINFAPENSYIYQNELLAFSDGISWFLQNTDNGNIFFLGEGGHFILSSDKVIFYNNQLFFSGQDSTVRYSKNGFEESYEYKEVSFLNLNDQLYIYNEGIGILDTQTNSFEINDFGKSENGFKSPPILSEKDSSIIFTHESNGVSDILVYKNDNVKSLKQFKSELRWFFANRTNEYSVVLNQSTSSLYTKMEIIKNNGSHLNKSFEFPKLSVFDVEEIENGVRLFCHQFNGDVCIIKDINFDTGESIDFFAQGSESKFNHIPNYFTYKDKDYVATGEYLYINSGTKLDKVENIKFSDDDKSILFVDDYIYYIGVDRFKGDQLYRYNPESPNAIPKEIESQKIVKIFPNPTSIEINLSNLSRFNNVRIYDSKSNLRYNEVIKKSDLTIETFGWPAGIYHIQLSHQNGFEETHTIIKI